jgi:hypothetical protein
VSTRPATPRLDFLAQAEAAGSPNADIYRSLWANDIAREQRELAAFEAAATVETATGRIELARRVGGAELATLLELEAGGPSQQARAAVFADTHAMRLNAQRRRFDAATEGAEVPDEVA